MSQIEFIVDKHIWDILKGLFSIRTCGIDSVVWYAVFSFCQCNFYFSASRCINPEYPPLPLYLPCNMCVYVHVCMYIDVRYVGVCVYVYVSACVCIYVH